MIDIFSRLLDLLILTPNLLIDFVLCSVRVSMLDVGRQISDANSYCAFSFFPPSSLARIVCLCHLSLSSFTVVIIDNSVLRSPTIDAAF